MNPAISPQSSSVYINQHCQSCSKEREGLQEELSDTMDLSACLGGCAVALIGGFNCVSASLIGFLYSECLNNSKDAKSIIDKHLKNRKCCQKCCHVDSSSSSNAGYIMETGYGKDRLADNHLPAQFQTLTIESKTNSAVQGCLTSPTHSTVAGNNGNTVVLTEPVNHSANLSEDVTSGCGTQGDRNKDTSMQIIRI